MNNYCVPLNILDNPFKSNINPFDLPKVRHTKLDPDELLNDQIKNLFLSFNLEIFFLEVFYSHPVFVSAIHTDLSGGDYTKINWIFGGRRSLMYWYKLKEDDKNSAFNITDVGTSSIHYEEKDCVLLYKHAIAKPSLVQVGIPHSIRNPFEDRWCVSSVFRDKTSKKRLTMSESIKIFKDYID